MQRKVGGTDPVAVVTLKHQLEVKDRRIDELMTMLGRKEDFNEVLIRMGLNLPEGNNDRDEYDPVVGDQAIERTLVEDIAPTAVIDGEVVALSQTTIPVDDKTLFPTFARGLRKVGDLLRADIAPKQNS